MMKRFKIEYLVSALALALVCFMAGVFYGRNSVRYEHGVVVEVENALPSAEENEEGVSEEIEQGAEEPRPEEDAPESREALAGETAEPEQDVESPADESDGDRTGLIDLNTATAAELETLPGIGPVLAQRVIDYREEHGGFRTIEEILQVSGIGDKKFEAIQSLITVR